MYRVMKGEFTPGSGFKSRTGIITYTDSMKDARAMCDVPLHYSNNMKCWHGLKRDTETGRGTEYFVMRCSK